MMPNKISTQWHREHFTEKGSTFCYPIPREWKGRQECDANSSALRKANRFIVCCVEDRKAITQ